MTDTEPPAVPPLYWDGCQFYADAGKGTHYVDAPYEGRYAVMFLTSSGDWAHQGNVDELPEAVMRLNLPTDIAAGAVPDTAQAAVAAAQAPESPTDSTPKAGRWGSGEAETATDTVQAPDVTALLARCDAEDRSAGEFGWIQTTEIRRLLGTDTTPDRLAWISETGETAAAERQARYQETACARRPAEEHPDA